MVRRLVPNAFSFADGVDIAGGRAVNHLADLGFVGLDLRELPRAVAPGAGARGVGIIEIMRAGDVVIGEMIQVADGRIHDRADVLPGLIGMREAQHMAELVQQNPVKVLDAPPGRVVWSQRPVIGVEIGSWLLMSTSVSVSVVPS